MTKRKSANLDASIWFDGTNINEALFCDEFLSRRKIIFANGAFFTPDGRVTDDLPFRGEIYEELKCCAVNNIPRKITNILEVMKLAAHVEDFAPEADRIHLANGTLKLDGSFTEGRPDIVRSRLPVAYRPDAPVPTLWLSFLDGLLYAEDIPTLQEFIGYCLIPSNKGQRMMVIKGNGGEGKSQIGAVLGALLGSNMKDGSIGKISENRFARADLEHILLCVDDDMRMEALRQTNYVKSIVTAQGKMDLERKGKQSYQGWMFARLLAFSNGDLQALYDRSDGFYRRQLVLTTREKPRGRIDDPDLAEKMKAEVEGIFLWAFEGLDSLNRILDDLYEKIEDAQTRLDEVDQEIAVVEKSAMTKKSIFEMLEGFSKYYDVMSPEDKKALLQAMVSFIELYPEKRDDKHLIKTIHFTFPVTYDGESGALFIRTNEQQVETVVLLSRETNPLTVEVRMEVETAEVKEHPTYKRIQEYVQEKYGFKVHTAYIAEVKRMVGLDMYKTPNAVEQRKHAYHPCPPEKVEAIKDALRHFGLVSE